VLTHGAHNRQVSTPLPVPPYPPQSQNHHKWSQSKLDFPDVTHLHIRPRRILKTRITIHLNLNQEDAGFPLGASSNPTKRSPSPHPHSTYRITKVHWTRTRSTIPDRVSSLPLKTPTTPSTTRNPHLHRNCLRDTEAPPAERGDTITTPLHRCKVEYLREAAATPIVRTDLPPIATETETGTRTGTGTGTVIAIGGRIHPVAADGTTNTTRTTIVDIPLPHVATFNGGSERHGSSRHREGSRERERSSRHRDDDHRHGSSSHRHRSSRKKYYSDDDEDSEERRRRRREAGTRKG